MPNKSRNAANLVSDNNLFVNAVTDNTGIGTTNPTSKLHVVGNVLISGVTTIGSVTINSSGIITASNFVGNLTGTATTAVKLETQRTFELTGDVVASPISFDGTGNVSLAATIQPNSVGLGSDTTGDYVQTISGTLAQILVTGGTGESSTPTISITSNPTLPGNVTVANDLQVNNNLNVTGNITIGGTSAYIISNDFRVRDADIVTGFTTDSNGNDVSNDTTANHGGISVASTEGNPLISIFNPGVGETTPATYKKIMWFKSGSFAGLNTDAWLINYAVGIGSTQFPSGTRLAAGSVQFTERDLAVVRNINASGVVTASSFIGNLTGTATTANNLSNAANITTGTINSARLSGTYNINVSYANTSGISTVAQGLTGTPNITVGIVTASSFVGNLTGTATTATNAQGLTGTPNITVGVVTATSFVGNLTGTATTATNAQGLIGTPNITVGVVTATSFVGNLTGNVTGTATTATNAQGLIGTPNITVGVVTATSFVGNLTGNVTGTATTANNLSNAANITTGTINSARLSGTYNINVSYATTAGIATYATSSGIATYATTAGIATYATTAGIATNVIGGIASVTQLAVSGVSTLGTIRISSGIITATSGVVTYYGDGSNLTGVAVGSGVEIRSNNSPLGVAATINFGTELITTLSAGIATVTTPIYWVRNAAGIHTTSNVGVGTTSPTQQFHVQGNLRVTGGIYDSNNLVGTANSVLISTGTGVSWSSPRSTTILSGSTGNIKRANNTYFNFGGNANATESVVTVALPASGIMSNLYIKLSAAAGAVGTGYTFTIRKNSAATSLVVTINGTSSSGSDLVNSVSFASGDTFSIEADPTTTQPTDNLDVIWTARYVTN
jgi:tetrahydromethanopterin S-methyltransferase subunit A